MHFFHFRDFRVFRSYPRVNPRKIGRRLLSLRASPLLLSMGNRILFRDGLRRRMVRTAGRMLEAHVDANDHHPTAWRERARERKLLALAVLHTVDRLIERRALSPRVARTVMELWGRALCLPWGDTPAGRRFTEEHGHGAPWFLTISPGQECNLRCQGCYANTGTSPSRLAWPVLDRIITEAKALWGIPLIVLSGGEPFAYRSEGRDVLHIVEKHRDCLFLIFTNGTLIDRETASRLAGLGNATAAISVEGLRERTDERRGRGVFDRALSAMARLREAGVPFGISATVTRDNCEELMSDRFLELFFEEQSAFYGFLFHYMPIGRSPSLEPMPSPEQRIEFWRRTLDVIRDRRFFLYDFWNAGPLVEGCVSAGRQGGYFYIDWSGKVMPCVFAPYSADNIHDVYARGGTLNDVWSSPFFRAIRQWQRDYGYGRPEPTSEGNWLRPCPVRDHYHLFREWVDRYGPDPEDETARKALLDDDYRDGLISYGSEFGKLSQEIWERYYLRRK